MKPEASAHDDPATYSPATWQAAVDALIGSLPDDLRKPISDAISQAMRAKISGAKPRFTLHTEAECLADQPPIEWLVDNFISAGSVNIVAGMAKAGKTLAVFDLAVAVSRGKPWLGLLTSKRNVLIVDEESGGQRMFRRLGATLRGHDTEASGGIQFVTLAGIDLTAAADVAAIESLIEETSAGLVVLDALVDMLGDADENSNSEVQKIFMALRGLSERTGAAFIVLHHHGKAGGYRGASAMSGAVDMMCALSKEGTRLSFEVVAARDSDTSTFGALMNFGEGTFNLSPAEPTTTCVKALSKSQQYVIDFLTAHGNSGIADIQNHADQCTETLRALHYMLWSLAAWLRGSIWEALAQRLFTACQK